MSHSFHQLYEVLLAVLELTVLFVHLVDLPQVGQLEVCALVDLVHVGVNVLFAVEGDEWHLQELIANEIENVFDLGHYRTRHCVTVFVAVFLFRRLIILIGEGFFTLEIKIFIIYKKS